ncbi:MAG: type IX secretion system sortase PorU, partial [Bacteroidota bacterium]
AQDFLLLTSPDTSGTVQYTVRNLSSRDVSVLDVSSHANVRRVSPVAFDPNDPSVCTFQLPQTAGSVRTIAVVGPNGYKTPANARKISNSNLHGIAGRVDFIIISPQEFLADANRLKAFREQRDSLKTLVADVEQVYNEFSGGMQDPMAIRDFLKYAQTNWAFQRQYALLLGGGHYDYKNISTSVRNWIPPYESVESISRINSFTSDDYFVFLTPGDNHVSMALSRIPARSTSEATAMVDKIIAYETTAPYDSWRNRITFVADDGLTSTADDLSTHTYQAERLAQTFTPASFERRKIYIVEYPTVSSATGRRKPEANKAIVDAVNRGTLIMNYTGHGNDKLWAHEYIFTKDENIPQLTNKSMETFLVGATCNFGQYDNPNEQSAGELMLVMGQGGAVAEVTASRVVYSTDNAEFNYRLYSYLFQRDANGRPPRLGDVMWLTKQDLNSTNDLKFHLLGDPTMRLAIPRAVASVDSVNGNSTGQLTYMQSLGKVSVTGGVRRQDGSLWSTFNGTGLMELFDSKRQVVVPEWGDFTFDVNGSLLYRGEVSVNDGVFKAVFPIPKDVTFGNRSRISFYASGDSTDAVGFTENVAIQGTDTTAVPDTTGPRIDIFLNDATFRSGDVVKPDALLMVNLSDDGGINTSSAGIGHRLQATMTNPDATLDLTDYYRGKLDQYQSGQVQYPLTGLAEGHHELAVKAWDIFNNSAEARVTFDVRVTENLDLLNVFNFPNPFSAHTTFTFERSSTDRIDVEIKIYTVAGRLIKVLQQEGLDQRFVQIDWEGRDQDDNQVANGVYFYKVIARTQDRMSATETIGKLTVMR